MKDNELEFKIVRSIAMQSLYHCLYTIIAFAGGFTGILSAIVIDCLFLQAYYDTAIRAAWLAISVGVLTLFALSTLTILRLHEATVELRLKLQFKASKNRAVQDIVH